MKRKGDVQHGEEWIYVNTLDKIAHNTCRNRQQYYLTYIPQEYYTANSYIMPYFIRQI